MCEYSSYITLKEFFEQNDFALFPKLIHMANIIFQTVDMNFYKLSKVVKTLSQGLEWRLSELLDTYGERQDMFRFFKDMLIIFTNMHIFFSTTKLTTSCTLGNINHLMYFLIHPFGFNLS